MKNGVIVPANRAMLIESRPTSHKLIQGDARNLSFSCEESSRALQESLSTTGLTSAAHGAGSGQSKE